MSLKIDLSRETGARVTAMGSPLEIAAEICGVIHHLYSDTAKADPSAAEAFKLAILTAILPFGPVWERDSTASGDGSTVIVMNDPRKKGGGAEGMKIYKPGEICPCCGSPISLTDPISLFCFSVAVAQLGLSAKTNLPATGKNESDEVLHES